MSGDTLVSNASEIITIFGEWPSFHDAEVLSVRLDRGSDAGALLEAVIHVFRMTSQVNEAGHFVLADHTRVTLEFRNIVLHSLQWFNEQNVLAELAICEVDPSSHDDRRIAVEFQGSYGVNARLLCDEVAVVAVEPYDAAV